MSSFILPERVWHCYVIWQYCVGRDSAYSHQHQVVRVSSREGAGYWRWRLPTKSWPLRYWGVAVVELWSFWPLKAFTIGGLPTWFESLFSKTDSSAQTYFWRSLMSSICINLVVLSLGSLMVFGGFLLMLLEKTLFCRSVVKWCLAISSLRFFIFTNILLKWSTKLPKASSLPGWTLTRVIRVRAAD